MNSPRLPIGYRLRALRTLTLPPADHTNCYLVGDQQGLIVDPGASHPGERDRLDRLIDERRGNGATFAAIFLTHHHGDHVGGAQYLVDRLGLPLWAHPLTLSALGWQGRAIHDGERLTVDGDRQLLVIHVPGHAVGHLCLFEPGQRVLIGGDMVPGIGTTLIDPDGGDMNQYLTSLERLADLQPAVLLPAHGPIIGDPANAIRRLITHRRGREQRVLAALGPDPIGLEQITDEAYGALPPATVPLAQRSTLAHLLALEARQLALRTGDRWASTTSS